MNKTIINLRHKSFVVFLLATTFLFLPFDSAGQTTRKRPQAARVVIGAYGYEPASIRLKRGIPARVTFLRTTDSTCATEVVFADYGIRRDLPLNQAVTVSFTPRKAGEFSFTCGMNMHRGKLIVS